MADKKLIVDTDIGTDVDDAFAVLLALSSPEFELAAITLVHAEVDIRARIAAKLLDLAGRTDVPIFKGVREPISGKRPIFWMGNEDAGLDLSDAGAAHVQEGAVEAIIELARSHGKDLAIAPIGPLSNIASAMLAAPDVMAGIGRLYIMGSTFTGVGRAAAAGEHNISVDPEAASVVLASGVPITLVGLNATMQVTLSANQIEDMRGRSPLGDYMIAMADRWFSLSGSTTTYMHDPLAVASFCDPSIIKTARYCAEVLTEGEDSGKTVFSQEGEPKIDVAVEVEVEAFNELFFSRIHSRV